MSKMTLPFLEAAAVAAATSMIDNNRILTGTTEEEDEPKATLLLPLGRASHQYKLPAFHRAQLGTTKTKATQLFQLIKSVRFYC